MGIDWKEYERRKKKLPKNLTSKEYEHAIEKIVKQLEKEEKGNGRKN